MTDQTQVGHASKVGEKFDLNQARLSGKVQRMWASGPNVIIRLAIRSQDGQQPGRATLMLPQGCVNGQPVTLLKGDEITVAGHLIDAPYTETGLQFIEKSPQGEQALEALPGLAEIAAERVATYLVIEALEFDSPDAHNEVALEGNVVRVWVKKDQQFARLAVYDQHTISNNGRTGKRGRSWRKPHYISIHIVDGIVGGRPITLQAKDRIRISGHLSESRYSETLGLFLMRNKKIGLLADAPNADDLRSLRSPRVATYVIVESLLQFTK